MEAAIEGLLVLHALQPPSELFTLGEGDACVSSAWPEHLFPFLLVSMGSGVSVLRVDGVRDLPNTGLDAGSAIAFGSTHASSVGTARAQGKGPLAQGSALPQTQSRASNPTVAPPPPVLTPLSPARGSSRSPTPLASSYHPTGVNDVGTTAAVGGGSGGSGGSGESDGDPSAEARVPASGKRRRQRGAALPPSPGSRWRRLWLPPARSPHRPTRHKPGVLASSLSG